MIRDRIVVGLQDAGLSEKLQLEPEPTLESAIAKVQQSELIKKQLPTVRGDEQKIEAISNKKSAHFKRCMSNPLRQLTKNIPDRRREPESCSRCGKTPGHNQQHCPARLATCHKCQKKGHFQKMCRTKKVETVSTGEESCDQVFLGAVESSGESWKVTLFLNKIPIQFKIDTGAEVSVIPEALSKPFSSIYSDLLPKTSKAQANRNFKYVDSLHAQCVWTKRRQDKRSTLSKVWIWPLSDSLQLKH